MMHSGFRQLGKQLVERVGVRLSLIGKLTLALCVGALLTAAVVGTAWLSFNQVVALQRRIIDDTVPALEAVQAATQINTRTLALVEQLARAPSLDAVSLLKDQGQAQLDQVRALLERLQRQSFEPQLAQAMATTVDDMGTNLAQQAALTTQALQLNTQAQAALRAQQQAADVLLPLAEALAANASTYSTATVSGVYTLLEHGANQRDILQSLDRLIEVDIDRMERMSELQLVCFRLKTTLGRIEGIDTQADGAQLAKAFAADLGTLSRRLQDFRDPTRKASAQASRDVLAMALAPTGLFALQAARNTLNAQLASQRQAWATLAVRLDTQGGSLLQASRQAVENVSTGSRAAIARGALVFLVAGGVVVLALLATLWLILRYELLGRLKDMELAMRALLAGQYHVVVRPSSARNDPLAPLVQALAQFREHAIERERLAQSLREHHQQLEQQVLDRTAELSHSNALLEREVALHAQAQQDAEDANRAKTEFLGSLSHELRTPLSGVSGSVHLLRDTPLDSRQSECVRMISYANTTLLETLDDMLGFSRLEAGKQQVVNEPFTLSEVIDDMLALQTVSAQAKGVALVRDIGPGVPDRLVGDRRKLNQILLNTIGNAIKFTDEGEVTVAVACVEPTEGALVAGDALRLRFRVIDTGIGIPASQQQAVFKPFVQVESAAHRRHGGTGLGLAICQRLVALMGGQLSLQSQEGEGTTVCFELPFVAAPTTQVVEHPANGAVAHQADGDPAPRSLAVVVVEDDEINRTVCQRYLESMGHRVHLAHDGESAIDLLHRLDHVDCVLMDISLPGASGLEVTQTIRALEGGLWQHLPIVGMSAHVTQDTTDHPAAATMVSFLSKPFQRSALARALAQAVQTYPGAGSAAVGTLNTDLNLDLDLDLDLAYLAQELEDFGHSMLLELLTLFGREAASLSAALQSAADRGDWPAVGRLAHQLCSAAGNVGLQRLVETCRHTERAARADQLDASAFATLMGQLKADHQRGLDALQQWLASADGQLQVADASPANR